MPDFPEDDESRTLASGGDGGGRAGGGGANAHGPGAGAGGSGSGAGGASGSGAGGASGSGGASGAGGAGAGGAGGAGAGAGGADPERDALIAAASTAWRPRDPRGELRAHPAWHDLDPHGRELVFETTRALRELEAALDPDGLSTTARAVLARIRRSR